MTSERIRERVSAAYAEALERSRAAEAGCCSSVPAAVAAKLAGYERAELATDAEASASSFGCGNPLAFADVAAGETVVDLGCGAGLDLLIAAQKVGPAGRVIGVDMTDDMLAAARGAAERAGATNVEVRKGVIEDLPIEDASVDWVISNCVVNLSPEKERVFAEIHRILRPGGRFSISDIVADALPPEIRELAAAYAACIGGTISEAEYVAGLEAAGLRDVHVAERFAYTADQIRGLIMGEGGASEALLASIAAPLARLDGRVASVRMRGRRP